MNDKLLKPYEPKETESRIYKLWEESGYFNPDKLPSASWRSKETFTIMLPPPNVTGVLHMGHALNATIQDIIIRQKRMQGYKTLWLPGTDHAGIATQNVVEKMLKKNGASRHDLGKEKFIEEVWKWKEQYGNLILDQLKKIGSSCDWSRARFTMDEKYSEAVKEAFLHYYKKEWIYQGERVINWCARCQTSLSDLEIEYEDQKGKLYFVKYPIKDSEGFITVATTRPETMLGDMAVAVNPSDDRYKKIIGKLIILPIQKTEVPIIADESIDKDFGTGAVKVTPAHSIADAELAERHKLNSITIIDQYGKMTGKAGQDFEGLSTKEAREKVVEKLKELNLLEKVQDYENRISVCYRCNTVIEPRLSLQWFLKMSELAKKAIEPVEKGEIKFNDEKWKKIYLDWLYNVKDWCVSRQTWWGHKIPLEGVEDVLDTWFSSALWPFATLGWPASVKTTAGKPNPTGDLKEFYPTQILSTARDIINLWVARMIFSGLEFMGEKPFSNIIIHPTVLAKDGRRMSKSLGTGVDPLVLVERYGADATRFGLIYQMMGTQDMKFDESHLLAGKKFANKLWNISRFVISKTGDDFEKYLDASDSADALDGADGDSLLKNLKDTTSWVNRDIDKFEFGPALHTLYNFIWHDFADKYIERAKTKETDDVKRILARTLVTTLKLLHPFMPFITEEIWSMLPLPRKELLIIETWPNI